jgi:hypothetical protein
MVLASREFIAVPDNRKRQIVFKWPDVRIRKYSKAIVDADEVALFVNTGQVIGTMGPGRHQLDADELVKVVMASANNEVATCGVSPVSMGNVDINLPGEDEAQLKGLAKETVSRLAGGFNRYAAGEMAIGAGQGRPGAEAMPASCWQLALGLRSGGDRRPRSAGGGWSRASARARLCRRWERVCGRDRCGHCRGGRRRHGRWQRGRRRGVRRRQREGAGERRVVGERRGAGERGAGERGAGVARHCGACGSDNPPVARFCASCGTSLVQVLHCQACGAVLTPGQRLCVSCGTAAPASAT